MAQAPKVNQAFFRDAPRASLAEDCDGWLKRRQVDSRIVGRNRPHAVEDGTMRVVAEFARIRASWAISPNSGEFSYGCLAANYPDLRGKWPANLESLAHPQGQ